MPSNRVKFYPSISIIRIVKLVCACANIVPSLRPPQMCLFKIRIFFAAIQRGSRVYIYLFQY